MRCAIDDVSATIFLFLFRNYLHATAYRQL